VIIKYTSPAFGKLAAIEQSLEGDYRAGHSTLLNHAEQIAFYKGADWERALINTKFTSLHDHISSVLNKKFWMGIFDAMLFKYGAVLVGYAILGLPVFGPGSENYLKEMSKDPSKITRDYVRNSSLLINLAKGIGKIVASYRDMQNLSGYTSLVYEMKQVIDDLEAGKY